MSRCDLQIELDEPDRVYRLGETIRGRVSVRVDTACRCRGLTITRLWRARGGSVRRAGGGTTQTLFEGTWEAGDQASFPFSFEIPPGPLSYPGRQVQVVHQLEATADLAWAVDPTAERPFEVVMGDRPRDVLIGTSNEYAYLVPVKPDDDKPFTLNGMGFMLLLGLFLGVTGVMGLLGGELGTAALMLVGGLAFGGGGAWFIYEGNRNRLAQRRVGPIDLDITPRRLAPGETFELTLRFTPRAELQLNGVRAILHGQEFASTVDHKERRKTWQEELHREEVVLSGRRRVRPGEPVSLHAQATIPAQAPFTFVAPDVYVEWFVEFHVDVEGWSDWKRSVLLAVLPR